MATPAPCTDALQGVSWLGTLHSVLGPCSPEASLLAVVVGHSAVPGLTNPYVHLSTQYFGCRDDTPT